MRRAHVILYYCLTGKICDRRPYLFTFTSVHIKIYDGIFSVRRASGRTESFVVEGVSVEHDLVPLITSDIGVYGEK